MPGERDSFERLEAWIRWKIGRPLTGDERQQLTNHVRAIVGDVMTMVRDLIGRPQ